MHPKRKLLLIVPVLFLMAFVYWIPKSFAAARVTGVLVNAGGTPEAGRNIHFENQVTRDIYLSPTGAKGEFSVSLPGGVYMLRKSHGAILMSGIIVIGKELKLGAVTDPGWRFVNLFERQAVIPVIIHARAPATAYLTSEQPGVGSAMPIVPVVAPPSITAPAPVPWESSLGQPSGLLPPPSKKVTPPGSEAMQPLKGPALPPPPPLM
ncbi:MAG: hypothetical protein ACREP6_09840 [Candidatus Binataceae bacterium]